MTGRVRGLPPGRAGRTWLRRRRGVAAHGADLLEQKLRALAAEETGFALRAERSRVAWEEAVAELDQWVLRSVLLGAERGIRLAGDGADTAVEVEWRVTMGVRYPASASCRVARADAECAPEATAALIPAAQAAERAVLAAVDHAVASAALTAVRDEIAATRRRRRALTERWIPRLDAASAELTVALEDQEHEEQVRLRWAAGRGTGRGFR
ncbi:MAG: V-type ATP synthase subunit D [Candidatus Nanopelagicales bacterium]